MSRRKSESAGWEAVVVLVGGLALIAVRYFIGIDFLASMAQ